MTKKRTKKSKRELIEPTPGDKRFVRRDDEGRFTESDDVTNSLRSDVRQKADRDVQSGHGDEGDHAS